MTGLDALGVGVAAGVAEGVALGVASGDDGVAGAGVGLVLGADVAAGTFATGGGWVGGERSG
jgi:hypothetical protein